MRTQKVQPGHNPTFAVRIPKELAQRVRLFAVSEGRPLYVVVQEALEAQIPKGRFVVGKRKVA